MKKHLLLFAVAICIQGKSQKKDTIDLGFSSISEGTTITISTGTVYLGSGYDTVPTRYDTTKVIMLYSDTSIKIIDGDVWENTLAYWTHGYTIHKKTWKEPIWEYADGGLAYWPGGYVEAFIGYLDEKKKPLSKSIVVWLTKEIK